MYYKFYLAWIFVTVFSPVYACRHNLVPTNIAFTIFETLLTLFVILFGVLLCLLLPKVAACFCEIRQMNAERRRRFQAYRKVQSLNRSQVHVPIHFLRNYYEQKRTGSKSLSSENSRQIIRPLI